LLTPRQIEELTSRLQKAYKRFLEQSRIDYEEWEQMTLPTQVRRYLEVRLPAEDTGRI